MNDRSRMMLYALTSLACVVWVYQSVKESMADGTLLSVSTIIFLVCIGIAAVYCAANALILWWRQSSDSSDESANNEADEADESDAVDESGGDEGIVHAVDADSHASDDQAEADPHSTVGR